MIHKHFTDRVLTFVDDLQDRLGRDSRDGDTRSGETMSTLSEGILEVQDAPSRKNRKQLTSTEYALQEIRYVL